MLTSCCHPVNLPSAPFKITRPRSISARRQSHVERIAYGHCAWRSVSGAATRTHRMLRVDDHRDGRTRTDQFTATRGQHLNDARRRRAQLGVGQTRDCRHRPSARAPRTRASVVATAPCAAATACDPVAAFCLGMAAQLGESRSQRSTSHGHDHSIARRSPSARSVGEGESWRANPAARAG